MRKVRKGCYKKRIEGKKAGRCEKNLKMKEKIYQCLEEETKRRKMLWMIGTKRQMLMWKGNVRRIKG